MPAGAPGCGTTNLNAATPLIADPQEAGLGIGVTPEGVARGRWLVDPFSVGISARIILAGAALVTHPDPALLLA